MIEDRASPQGTWTLAGGTIHHLAFNTGNEENQYALKARLEGMGYTDVSEQKDRNYFKSMYMRSPGGALFELAWTVARRLGQGRGPGRDRPFAGLSALVRGPAAGNGRRPRADDILMRRVRPDLLRIGAPPGSAAACCVFLHGRGQSPEEMAAGPLTALDLSRVTLLLPAAPGRSWYAARAIDPLTDRTRAELGAALDCRSRPSLDAARGCRRHAARARGILAGRLPRARIRLLGPPALSTPVLAFTGCRIGRAGDARPAALPFGVPVYLTGADADPWIPTQAMAEAAEELARGGAALRLDVFPGRPHEICAAELGVLAGALDDLAARRPARFGAAR